MEAETSCTHIQTNVGKIAIQVKKTNADKTPLILLHGVYFDHHLWDYQSNKINDRTVIAIDMPYHGKSREITKANWTLNDCADMLIEILDSLEIRKAVAVGHSWGSMTILRAAHRHPQRFESIGLCNMPLHAATKKQKAVKWFQHLMLPFRKFYMKKAAEALFGKKSLAEDPSLFDQLSRPMSILTDKEVKEIDKKVILDAEDTTSLILQMQVKAKALKGKEDYVPAPRGIETVLVEGGHISPLEEPQKVLEFIRSLTDQ